MKIFNINKKKAFILYTLIDTFFIGIGMGIPILSILLGFPTGWYIVKRLKYHNSGKILSNIIKYGLLTSLVTFIFMIIIWIPISTMLLDPRADFAHFGIPMILYNPKISFIGWIILMAFISPFLQLLTTIFASNITWWKLNKNQGEN